MVAANRVYMFLDEPNDTRIFDGKTPPEEIKGHVEFKNVHFSYVKDHEILHGINLDINLVKQLVLLDIQEVVSLP